MQIMEDTASSNSVGATNPRWLAPEILNGERPTLAAVSPSSRRRAGSVPTE